MTNPIISLLLLHILLHPSHPQFSEKCPADKCGPVLWPDGLAHGWDDVAAMFCQLIFAQTYENCSCSVVNFGNVDLEMLVPDQVKFRPPKSPLKSYDGVIDGSEELQKTADLFAFELTDDRGIKNNLAARRALSTQYRDWKKSFHEHGKPVRRRQYSVVHFEGYLEDNSPLYKKFVSDVEKLLKQMKDGRKTEVEKGVKKLIEKYGTHYVNRAYFGAIGYRDQFLRSYSDNSEVTHEEFSSTGGPNVVLRNLTFEQWQDEEKTAAEDVYLFGGFVDELVHRDEFKEYSNAVKKGVAGKWHKAIAEYYRKNVVKGCTKFKATNFNPKANVDDGTCKVSKAISSYWNHSKTILILQSMLLLSLNKLLV